jgi:hypothetical protein
MVKFEEDFFLMILAKVRSLEIFQGMWLSEKELRQKLNQKNH